MSGVVVAGAGGGIARVVVATLLSLPTNVVSNVTVLLRRPLIDAGFYYDFVSDGVTREAVKSAVDGGRLHVVQVDYEAVMRDNAGEAAVRLREDLAKHQSVVGMSCIGTFVKGYDNEEQFRRVDVETNRYAAAVMREVCGVRRFAYLSGMGASGAFASLTTAGRVKTDAEKSLRDVGFERLALVRPGGVIGRPRDAVRYSALLDAALVCMPFVSNYATDVAKAMIYGALGPAGGGGGGVSVFNVGDIRRVGKEFEHWLESEKNHVQQ